MVSRALIGRLTLFLILVLPPILPSSGISGVDYWLPYDLARYAPDVIPLQCNGPNTTWDHEASPDSAVCYRTHESLQHWETICLIWWFSVAGDKHEHVAGGVHTPGETHLCHIPHLWLTPLQSWLLHRCRPTKFKSERTPRASKWSMAPAPSSLRATSTSLGAGWSEQCNHNWDELSCD